MDTISIVKKFVEYADYQPERGSFILGSSTHQLHTICKNLNSFLEFDPSGTLAVIYLRKAYEVFLSHMQLDVVKIAEFGNKFRIPVRFFGPEVMVEMGSRQLNIQLVLE